MSVTHDIDTIERTIETTDRITYVDTEAHELYIIEVQPMAHYHKTSVRPKVIHKTPVRIEKFDQFINLVPVYDPEIEIQGQIKWKKSKRRTLERGIQETESDGYIVFEEKVKRSSKLFKAYFVDKTLGFFFADRYSVRLVEQNYTAPNRLRGKLGTPDTPIITDIVADFVDLTDQYDYEGATRVKTGDAKIKIPRSITKADLEATNKHIEINVDGGTYYRYTIVNERGIRPLQSYHWEVYLQRELQNA